MNILILCSIILPIISSVCPLYQAPFTHRFSEWIERSQVKDTCGWTCFCPDRTYAENVCVCQHEEKGSHQIESPYAALMIQLDCPKLNPRTEGSMTPVTVNLTMAIDPTPGGTPYPYGPIAIAGNEGVLKQLGRVPDAFPIRYYVKFGSRVFLMDGVREKELPHDAIPLHDDINRVVVLIPGWQSDFGPLLRAYDQAFENIIYSLDNLAIVHVDWLYGNQLYLKDDERIYEPAAANTVYAGYHLGTYLHYIAMKWKSKIEIYGFDLGAQVAHFAAKMYKLLTVTDFSIRRIRSITALDPPIYLFEIDGLNNDDADKVIVIHSNSLENIDSTQYARSDFFDTSRPEVIDDRRKNLIGNLLKRKFGVRRQIGDTDILINWINGIGGMQHYHPQCQTPQGESDGKFGCYSMMAARTFYDKMLQLTTNLNDIEDEEAWITHETLCSMRGFDPIVLNAFVLDSDWIQKIGPKEMLRTGNETFPPENHVTTNLVKHLNDVKDCGKFNLTPKSSTRVWQGSNAIKNQFPWSVCMIQEKINIPMFSSEVRVVEGSRPEIYLKPRYKECPMPRYMTKDKLYMMGREIGTHKIGQGLCTASIISNNWILTAAHCFNYILNGFNIIFLVGATDGVQQDGEKFTVRMDSVNPAHQNVFFPNAWNDLYDEDVKRCLEKYPLIDFNDERGHYRAEDPGLFLNEKEVIDTSECRPLSSFDNDRDYRFHSGPHVIGYDIALVKVGNSLLKNVNHNPICIKSSSSLDINTFSGDYYYAGYGGKGLNPTFGYPEHMPFYSDRMKLTWTSLNTKVGVANKNLSNEIEMITKLSPELTMHKWIHVVNVDKVNGHLVTSQTCKGDSGGPMFVLVSSGSSNYALQVGVLSFGTGDYTPGSIVLEREADPDKLDRCAYGFSYNVYAQKYFAAPNIFTKVSYFIDWIDEIINADKLSQMDLNNN